MATKSRISQALPLIVGLVVAGGGIAFGLSGGSTSTKVTYLSEAAAVGAVTRTAAGDGTVVAERVVGLSFTSTNAQLLSVEGTTFGGSGGASSAGGNSSSFSVTHVYVTPGVSVAKGKVLATASDGVTTEKITAPAAGVIETISAVVGYAPPSGNVVTMRVGSLLTSVSISEALIEGITVGQAASITVSALSATLTGTVQSIGYVAAAASGGVRQYPIVIALDSVPATLREGMSASATISVANKASVLSIPIAALGGTDAARTVQILAADGTVSSVPVEIGLIGDARVEITTGVAAGDKVVTGILGQLTTSSGAGGLGGFGGGGGGGGRRNPLP